MTFIPDIWWYNIFAHEDFYERFLSAMSQAPGAFDKLRIWDQCLMKPLDD